MKHSVANIITDAEPDAKRAKKTPKILDGTFFTIKIRENDSIEAECPHCHEVKKGNVHSTGNFLSHYKTKHANQLKDLKEYLKNTNRSKTPQVTR